MYVSISKSTIKGKKLMTIFYDQSKKKIKTAHFGQETASDYTIHGDLQRKMNYLERHEKREFWNDYMTPGALSRWILWDKPTIKESIANYMCKFKLTKY